jgi:aspartyl-tRNA(Asn)/glutamyl-tRNA(Gln) amidotransferase subunit A
VELLDAFRSGRSTPSAAVAECLSTLDEREPELHAFRTRCDDAASAAAAESDARWRRGDPRSLEGVPFAVKDNIETAGVLTTVGSRLFAQWVPARDAIAVRRVLDAGGILIGKTATPEFAFGDAIDGHHAVNPWHADHWTGGSSAGSAVALAAVAVPLALGTDTGGSIRVPASYCGVVGLKPSRGLVPRDGVVTVSPTLDHAGPMARTVDDVALLLDVLAGTTLASADESRPLRIGRPVEWFSGWGTPEVLRAADDAIGELAELGATVRDVSLPSAALAGMTAWTITVREFSEVRAADRDQLDEMTPSARERFLAGAGLTTDDYRAALANRTRLRREIEAVFADVDVLVTPATPTPAPRISPSADPLFEGGDAAWLERIARNFLIANVTGIPAMVVPVGSHEGLPIAVQILGPPGGDAVSLRAGRLLETISAASS